MNTDIKDYTLQVWEDCDLRSIQVKGYNRRITLYRISAHDFDKLFKLDSHNLRKDLQRPGLYIFVSWKGKRSAWKLYIGKSEQPLIMRLNRRRNSNIMKASDEVFILPFENYHHINYFEHLLINKFQALVSLWNKQKSSNMYTKNIFAGVWNDAEINRFSHFANEIERLLQLLSQNFQILLQKQKKISKVQAIKPKPTVRSYDLGKIYTVEKEKFFVRSRFSGRGKELIILKGSYTKLPVNIHDKQTEEYQKNLFKIKAFRNEMVQTKMLKLVGDKLVFQTDIPFQTPSQAGMFITGRSSNGYTDLNLKT